MSLDKSALCDEGRNEKKNIERNVEEFVRLMETGAKNSEVLRYYQSLSSDAQKNIKEKHPLLLKAASYCT